MNLITLDFEELYIPEPNSGCWLWLGATNGKKNPYGRIHRKGLRILAHVLSYKLFKGKLQKGQKVLHRCDTTLCVNPDHLFMGTQADNVADMMAKKRNKVIVRIGEKSSQAILTEAQVQYIRGSKKGNRELAQELHVTHSNISAIRLRKSWMHV